ncbi:hypothetical protein K492DRAFT_174223 [Lichtheimia hyalospora FSU 10163]|nr:hypothetical protein K492DRAFT_174223 [Lichtheimia hyalospora FSU 10163]
MKQQQQQINEMETRTLQARRMQLSNVVKNAVEQSGKESRRLLPGCTIIGCSSRLSLYHSVLPKGRRNVPQCFSTQCFTFEHADPRYMEPRLPGEGLMYLGHL